MKNQLPVKPKKNYCMSLPKEPIEELDHWIDFQRKQHGRIYDRSVIIGNLVEMFLTKNAIQKMELRSQATA